jgi:WD40 repeat protein/GTPase SAR1 family protein
MLVDHQQEERKTDMTKNDIQNIRKALFNSFDEVSLIALIQDHFEHLSDEIGLGRGLTKGEIISQLINYCVKTQNLPKLIFAIQSLHPELSPIISDAVIDDDEVRIKEDFDDAVRPSSFWGRNDELVNLEKWITDDKCKVVTVLGMGGIGKSSLVRQLAENIKNRFDCVFWRDLKQGMPVELFLNDCLKFISGQKETDLQTLSEDDRISLLIKYLQKNRCLLILDNAETILDTKKREIVYKDGYETYGRIIKRVGNTDHQSCLVITSREKPFDIEKMEGKRSPVRSEQLRGLDSDAARNLLGEKNIYGSDEEWSRLFEVYSFHPLTLMVVGGYIEDYLDGNIGRFLEDQPIVPGHIESILEEQLKRLSDPVKEVMYWLAIERGTISLSQLEKAIMQWLAIEREKVTVDNLQHDIVYPISRQELLETLDSLRRQSLIEKSNSNFTLQPVIMQYVTEKFIKIIVEEIITEKPRLLRTHALIQAQAKEYIMQSQIQFILKPIVETLKENYGVKWLEQRCKSFLSSLRSIDHIVPGYIAGNILNILIELQIDLTKYDFSNLAIWQANLKPRENRAIALHDVNFTQSDFRDTVFSETFDLILSVAYSTDGKLLAAGSASGDVIVWELSRGRQMFVLHGHTNWTRAVAFNSESNVLASGSGDLTIRLWDLNTGECLKILRGHNDWIRSLAFSPDGKRLISGGSDNVIRVWDVETGEVVKLLHGHTDWIWTVAFNSDGYTIASAGNDKTVRIWNIESGETLSVFNHNNIVRGIAFSPNGMDLASSCNDKMIRIWDLSTGQLKKVLKGHTDRLWQVCYDPSGNHIASCSVDKTIRIWDVNLGLTEKTLTGHDGWVFSVAYSPDGKNIVSGSDDQTVRLWDVKTGDCVKTFRGHTNTIQSICIGGDGDVLISGDTDRFIRLWDAESGEEIAALEGHRNRIQGVDISSDGKLIASCGDDQTVRVWSLSSLKSLNILKGHTSWVRSVRFSPDNKLIASGSDDLSVIIWNVETGRQYKLLKGHTGFVAKVVFSPDGNEIASASADKTIRIWDVKTGDTVNTLSGHEMRVNAAAFSSNGKYLASCSDDKRIIIWDVNSGKEVKVLNGHNGPIKSVVFSMDNTILVSGGDDQTVKLWSVETGECLSTLIGHSNRVWSVAVDSKRGVIASGSEDETIRIWNLKSRECINIIRSKKIYNGMNITGVSGLTDVQKLSLFKLGAVENSTDDK